MLYFIRSVAGLGFVLFALSFNASRVCLAQANTTASKAAEITAFGGYLLLDPGDGNSVDNGGSVGANYTRYFHFPVAPSLEIRANAADGPVANEKSYLIGIRAVGDLHRRFHPYADFLVGKGTIHYNTNSAEYNFYGLHGDESAVFNYGAGVDYDIANHFAAKVDVQAQRWRTGVTTFYYPFGVTLGITYRIPFRRYVAERDVH